MRRAVFEAIAALFPYIEKVTGSRVVIVEQRLLHTLFEQVQLKKFIDHFAVDCVFDVGANVGQFATLLRKKVGYRGPIVSFEPIPECADRLRSLAAGDNLWKIEQVALAERQGRTTFNIMAENEFSSLSSPDHSSINIFRDSNKVERRIDVERGTLDTYFDKYQTMFGFRRPYLKMDTQGNDLRVVAGAGDRLLNFCGLQSELAVVPLYGGAPDYVRAIEHYESLGFRLSAFVPNNGGHFPRLVEIDCIMFNEKFLPKA